MVAAVRELDKEFGDRISFRFIDGDDTKNRTDELEMYQLASRGHGLAAFARGGETVMTIAGHYFGEAELRVAIEQVLHE